MSHPALPTLWTTALRRDGAETPSRGGPQSSLAPISRMLSRSLTLPFDLHRSMYDRAVQVGLIQRSLLANAFFEKVLCTSEQMTLGPWARRV